MELNHIGRMVVLAAILLALAPPALSQNLSIELGGDAYRRGDFATALANFHYLAEQGNAEAQTDLGGMYSLGQGVPQSYSEAVKWYRRAADQDHGIAQFNLGNSYLLGQGVSKNYREAQRWYRRAADKGLANAQENLGLMFANGWGIPRDFAQAMTWFQKAADQGFADAQFNLGLLYAKGEDMPADYVEAAKWLRKAADQGNAEAQKNLLLLYARFPALRGPEQAAADISSGNLRASTDGALAAALAGCDKEAQVQSSATPAKPGPNVFNANGLYDGDRQNYLANVERQRQTCKANIEAAAIQRVQNQENDRLLGYQHTSFQDFLLDGKDLAAKEAKVSLGGVYMREGEADVLYADIRSVLAKDVPGIGTQRTIPLLTVEASRDFRQRLLTCQSDYACMTHGFSVTVLGRATTCTLTTPFGVTRKETCVIVEAGR